MAAPAVILLIGLRGAGKSAIGPSAAERLARGFVDLDAVTAALAGCATVAEAWRQWGEAAFRNAEARAITGLLFDGSWGARGAGLAPPGAAAVVALGGGTPTAHGVAAAMHLAHLAGRASSIYLRAQPATLRARLERADNRDRPSLTGADPLAEIEAVFAARDPLYCDLATHVVETDAMEEPEVVEAIVAACAR